MSRAKTFTLAALLTLLSCSSVADCQIKRRSALSIVRRMAARYATASAYQDSGAVLETKSGAGDRGETTVQFKTYFVRPHLFRFEWTERDLMTAGQRLSVVWDDGRHAFEYYSWDDPAVSEREGIDRVVAGATGVSKGSAHTIPALLMQDVAGFRLTELTSLSVLGEEEFEGEECFIVRGYHPFNFPIDMWISKRDYLLRKTKEPQDGGVFKIEIHRGVKLNGRISRGLFNYSPPPPNPKPAPQGALTFVPTAVCVSGRAQEQVYK